MSYILPLVMMAFWPSRLVAEDGILARGSSMPAGGEGETVALLLAIVKVAGSLILVVGLMLLAVQLIKKIGIGQGNVRDGRMINVLDSRMIAPKKAISHRFHVCFPKIFLPVIAKNCINPKWPTCLNWVTNSMNNSIALPALSGK